MSNVQDSNKTIIKNSSLLYFRMIIAMMVSLYTSRVILQTLGVEDYGIYNAVGGFVSIVSFINGAMVSATRRYITIGIGKENLEEIREYVRSSFYIHLVLGIIILFVVMGVGFWFVSNKMTVPTDKMNDAYLILITSVISVFGLCITVPHNALVVAHEKMGVFAYLSLFEVFGKLGIAFLIQITTSNRLSFYAILLCVIAILVRLLYVVYTHNKFSDEISYSKPRNVSLLKEMVGFAGWNFFGSMAVATYQHGINILLNIFFSPVVNAARAIAHQAEGIALSFASNIQQAINPQITKNYAQENLMRMYTLLFVEIKFTFIVVFVICVPLIMCADWILPLWLGSVPEYCVDFLRITMIITLFSVTSDPFTVAVQATGRVKRYQIINCCLLTSLLPLSYIALFYIKTPTIVYYLNVAIMIIIWGYRLTATSKLLGFGFSNIFKCVILPCILIVLVTIPLVYVVHLINPNNLVAITIYVAIPVICSFLIGLNYNERQYVLQLIKLK